MERVWRVESGEWSSAAFGLCFPVSNVNVFGNNCYIYAVHVLLRVYIYSEQ